MARTPRAAVTPGVTWCSRTAEKEATLTLGRMFTGKKALFPFGERRTCAMETRYRRVSVSCLQPSLSRQPARFQTKHCRGERAISTHDSRVLRFLQRFPPSSAALSLSLFPPLRLARSRVQLAHTRTYTNQHRQKDLVSASRPFSRAVRRPVTSERQPRT